MEPRICAEEKDGSTFVYDHEVVLKNLAVRNGLSACGKAPEYRGRQLLPRYLSPLWNLEASGLKGSEEMNRDTSWFKEDIGWSGEASEFK